jgi:RNA polymerase sigma factor (sigma-70 family)
VPDEAARRRAAVEIIARHERSLRQTARRYSLCAEDAEDAYQRALEILLTKAPSDRPRELIGWTHTVTKHEALAVRRGRERLLSGVPAHSGGESVDWVELIPAAMDGPDKRLERRERIARSREALQALKPAELRALTLLAEGYSYAEIGEITGFSQTKVNRCLAEGRERFRRLVSRSEDGSRCTEMEPLLSAFCDGETGTEETQAVREHLRACGRCRSTMRSYRAAAGAAAALAPALPISRSLLEKAQDALAEIHSRLPGGGGGADSAATQMAAAGGSRGIGMAALAKLIAVCAGTAGGAAACVAIGVAPPPLGLAPEHTKAATIERISRPVLVRSTPHAVDYEPAPKPAHVEPPAEKESVVVTPSTPATGAVEYAPPTPTPPAPPASSEALSGSAAGEFGP